MRKSKGPDFIKFFQPVLNALNELGSSARPKEVYSWIVENTNIDQAELEQINKNGRSKFENKVAFARFYLAKAGLIDTKQRGIWILTETGKKAKLSQEDAIQIFKFVQDKFSKSERTELRSAEEAGAPLEENTSAPDERAYINQDEIQGRLVELLRGMSDKGFEEFCARLLRHLGFEDVKVTGQRGDRGVDGEANLPINRFVRTKIMFQCKKYQKSVTPDQIRDFRGAIQGRAERGIFLTTGVFTNSAREEAVRENATAIEIVDIDDLIKILIEERLGVEEAKALTIDEALFRNYGDTKSMA